MIRGAGRLKPPTDVVCDGRHLFENDGGRLPQTTPLFVIRHRVLTVEEVRAAFPEHFEDHAIARMEDEGGPPC